MNASLFSVISHDTDSNKKVTRPNSGLDFALLAVLLPFYSSSFVTIYIILCQCDQTEEIEDADANSVITILASGAAFLK